jgi:hypothetical protein
MRPKKSSLTILAAASLLVVTAIPAGADVPPPAAPLSLFESIPGNTVDRDAGYSAAIPGTNNSLWLFGDSQWTGGGYWFGSTAAAGPYTRGLVPTGLTELLTPNAPSSAPSNRGPSGFLPQFPEGMRTPSGEPCINNGAAGIIPVSWPTGVAAIPNTNRMLIASHDVCVAQGLTGERFVLTEYTPSTNTLSNRARVFTNTSGLPAELGLGSPIFRNGYLYLMAHKCDGQVDGFCQSGDIYLARVAANATSWRNSANYRWWDGAGWSAAYADAASIIPGAKPNSAVYAGDFSAVGKGFVVVESTSIHGDITVWRSSSLTGTWTATHIGQTPCQGNGEGFNFCRAQIGHAELSTTTNLLLSYFNPADKHIRMMAIPW